ncbi:hypothetical protein SAMN05877838_2078 [Hoeflea halophila]|uniref:Peptide ABC transporter permease n=1 Tax=Hoeflea halophila TaxID=714899 RepID=A0A286IAN9_9HYPH|nr:hypothetical protein [Hoeflea halophila]SOE17185.1 hypothetical protein SAMN05877838_2078 [Hoeflea halophila]
MRLKENEKSFSAHKARQGEVILKTPTRRFVFILGLVGLTLLAVTFAIYIP